MWFKKKEQVSGWNSITIKQYKKIARIIEYAKDNDIDDIEWQVMILSFLEGNNKDYYLNMTIPEYRLAVQKINFLSKEPVPNISDKIVVNGNTYNVCVNLNNMSAGQFIDIVSTLENDSTNWSALMTTVCVPEGKKYGIDYKPELLIEEFEEHCRWIDVLGVSSFFRILYNSLLDSFLSYSRKKEKNQSKKKVLEDLQKTGIGL